MEVRNATRKIIASGLLLLAASVPALAAGELQTGRVSSIPGLSAPDFSTIGSRGGPWIVGDDCDLPAVTRAPLLLVQQGCCSHHDGVCGCLSDGRTRCCDGTASPTCKCSPPPPPPPPADTTPPNTTITGGPFGTVTNRSVSFTWTGSDNVTTVANLVYAYRLEPVAPGFSAHSSEIKKDYTDLPNGSYVFHVISKDTAGNVDPSSATRSFTVDVAPPLPPPPPPPPPPSLAVTLVLDRETVQAGDILKIGVSAVNSGPALVADVYLRAMLPPAAGPEFGCPDEDAVAFLTDGGATIVLACASDPADTFPPYFHNLTIPVGLNVTLAEFLSLVWPHGAPAGPYTIEIFGTPVGALADGALDAGDILAAASDMVTFKP
jgi:hypothetical protein